MKKEYIAPALVEIVVHTAHILNTSGQFTTNDSEATVTPSEEEYTGNEWASRRRRDKWDEEEYEEEEEEYDY